MIICVYEEHKPLPIVAAAIGITLYIHMYMILLQLIHSQINVAM